SVEVPMPEEPKSILDKKIPLWVFFVFFAFVFLIILGGVSSHNNRTNQSEQPSTHPYIIRSSETKRLGPNLLFAEIRVTITDKTATNTEVHAILSQILRRHTCDAAWIIAYWPGDDWNSFYTAGKLDWDNGRQTFYPRIREPTPTLSPPRTPDSFRSPGAHKER